MPTREKNEWYLEVYGSYFPTQEVVDRIDAQRMEIWRKRVRIICMKDKIDEDMYLRGKNHIGIFQIIENYDLDFVYGNIIKHAIQASKKEDKLEDLYSLQWYIKNEIIKTQTAAEVNPQENIKVRKL